MKLTSNYTPFYHANTVFEYHRTNDPVLLFRPRPLVQPRLEDLVPPVQTLHIIPQGTQLLSDPFPVLCAALLNDLGQLFVFLRSPLPSHRRLPLGTWLEGLFHSLIPVRLAVRGEVGRSG